MKSSLEKERITLRLDPVFVLGYSRSGTTMLRLMLNRHPDLFIPKESEYFQRIPRIYRNRTHKTNDINWLLKTLPSYYDAILDKEFFKGLLTDNLPGDNTVLIACLYQACAKSADKAGVRWGEKKPQNWQFVYRLRQWYPQAQFVHITRDPRDVVTSMEKSLPQFIKLRKFFPAHLIVAWHWRYLTTTLFKQSEFLSCERYFHLKYEDLVSNPVDNLTSLCKFLSLDRESVEDMLSFQEDASTPGIGDTGTHMVGTRQKVNLRSIGTYRAFLSDKQISEIEFVCGETMKKIGYLTTAPPPPWIDRVRISLTCELFTTIWKLVRIVRRLFGSL